MKYCEDFAALLDLWLDGELPPEEMVRVQAHLDECPACRAYVDDALAIRASFPQVEDTPVPDGFAEGVMAGQTRLLNNNYVPLTVEDMVEIYQSVY